MAAALALPAPALAQDAVLPATDKEALFTSPDPKLHRNKQAALHIVRDLLEAGHWELAETYLTERYIQHNPLVASGRARLLEAVKQWGLPIKPIPARMTSPVVAVVAEGDFVVVSFVRDMKDPRDPSRSYTTTWFDMWRFVDGRADEHWDGAEIPPMPAKAE
ncbi:nuclear transport factor 2 family protein [Novosphingobium piscinae]|nr:nuclear transport factor 2 family protein [Novosphingobium piscinae]